MPTTQPSAETYAAIANLLLQISTVIGAITALIVALRAGKKSDHAMSQTQTVAQATQVMAADPKTPTLEPELQSRLDNVVSGTTGNLGKP